MTYDEISEQIQKAHTEALRTGDWSAYNRLSLSKSNSEVALAEAEKIEIEKGKAIFYPEFKKLNDHLEKKLADPALSFVERLELRKRITSLAMNWQEKGVGNIDTVRAIRDSVADELRALSEMHLDKATLELHSKDRRAKIAELDAIIAQAQTKGLI